MCSLRSSVLALIVYRQKCLLSRKSKRIGRGICSCPHAIYPDFSGVKSAGAIRLQRCTNKTIVRTVAKRKEYLVRRKCDTRKINRENNRDITSCAERKRRTIRIAGGAVGYDTVCHRAAAVQRIQRHAVDSRLRRREILHPANIRNHTCKRKLELADIIIAVGAPCNGLSDCPRNILGTCLCDLYVGTILCKRK